MNRGEKHRGVGLLHRLVHLTGLFSGHVVAEWHTDGWLWVGFRCGTCGEVSSAHRTERRHTV